MKVDEFRQKFTIDTDARKGIKGVPKNAVADFPEAMTADKLPFDQNKNYFYFNEQKSEVCQTAALGLRQIKKTLMLGSMGLPVVAVAELRASRNDALGDGQKYFLDEIEKLREKIREFEAEKTPEVRSLKSILMAKG